MWAVLLLTSVMQTAPSIETRQALRRSLEPVHRTHRLFELRAPALPVETSMRVEDVRRAENLVVSALERVQHLGPHRDWFWVMPTFGSVTGGTLRFDFR